MGFLIRVAVNAFAIWVVSLVPFLHVTITPFAPGGDLQLVISLLAIAALFAVVNTIVGTAIRIVAFPLFVLTLGLFSLLLNGILLWVTAWVMSPWDWGLSLDGFWPAVLAGILLSLINWVFGILLRPQKKRR
ncbi:phage holin family protein [Microbacterium betulae]|uniref:Phage holin family protein n=1 Tax=Microbacterium betulae TaxID=2981139 RepID=A0AA97FHF2_9MICO|nr:phage holin family protein [Microbacterium sp. AB]WOF22963.1 phage holin family protein [Microbacterium sp. AB]